MKRTVTLALALALVSCASTSFAAGTAEQRSACTPDVFRLCGSEIPFVSKIVACLKKNKSKLSPGCRTVFNAPTTTEASARTRSLGDEPTAHVAYWCNFHQVAKGADQQKWLEWCGPNAHE